MPKFIELGCECSHLNHQSSEGTWDTARCPGSWIRAVWGQAAASWCLVEVGRGFVCCGGHRGGLEERVGGKAGKAARGNCHV